MILTRDGSNKSVKNRVCKDASSYLSELKLTNPHHREKRCEWWVFLLHHTKKNSFLLVSSFTEEMLNGKLHFLCSVIFHLISTLMDC